MCKNYLTHFQTIFYFFNPDVSKDYKSGTLIENGLKGFATNTPFFYKQHFISNARLKLAKTQANAKQQPEAEL